MKSIYDSKYPYHVGFENIFDTLQRLGTNLSPTQTAYPPYNIVALHNNKYLIEIAVAGINQNDIDVSQEDNILTIQANPSNTQEETKFIYNGIAGRKFNKKFALADTVQVTDVSMDNGILKIELINNLPEKNIKRFSINKTVDLKPPDKQLLTEQSIDEKNQGNTK